MNFGSVVKGVVFGAAVGATWYVLTRASEREKRNMKRHVGKALKEAGAVLDDVTSIVM